MTIKAKITTALVFLFAVVLLIGGLGMYAINRLSDDSEAILQDNYISLEYAVAMQKALADLSNPDALPTFAASLKKQQTNVTEVGEQEATDELSREFARLRPGRRDSVTVYRVRQALFQLDDLNRRAIMRKNETARQTAKDAQRWLAFTGTICGLILLSLIVSFPGYVANPLRELTRGIQQIADRRFEERLHVKSSDEFGQLARSFNAMAQKLDQYEHSSLAKVLFEKQRIDTLIQTMSEGILGLDENRRVLFANPVICRLLGEDEVVLKGRYAPDVATINDLMRTLIQDVMEVDQPNANSPLKIFDNGKENFFNRRTHTVSFTRPGEAHPQQAGYVIVLENITAFKELDLAKTNFIATVSHELKTPLSSVKMSLKLLDDSRVGSLNDEQRDLLGHIRADADRLLNITGELLNMAQVESGQIQLKLQPVAPAAIVQFATDALRMQAAQKSIMLDISVPDTLPPVMADPDKISWVLINFLSNAIRHSPEESRIDVSALFHGQMIEFRVRDYGPGIRTEHQSRVFDRYFKATGQGGQSGGTGLGLTISSEFIRSMQGEIGLDTSVTNGAAFYFRLPTCGN